MRANESNCHPILRFSMLGFASLVCLIATSAHLNSQTTSVTLRGVVFDSATAGSLDRVAIHLNQNTEAVFTGSLGGFTLRDVPLGAHTITLAKDGFAPRLFAVEVTSEHRDTVDIGSIPLAATHRITATISGTVRDISTNRPVIASGIYLNGDLVKLSTDRGRFTTDTIFVRPGLNTLEFKRIGYEPFETRLWAIQDHTELDLTVHLVSIPVSVPTVVVEANYLREFNQRRQWGPGHYITQTEIEERHPHLISDMLHGTPGIRVLSGKAGGNRVLATSSVSFSRDMCPPALFIDGHQVITGAEEHFAPGEDLDHLVHPDNVAAIEVYPRPSQIPVQFKMRDAACGVIVVWTRR